MSKKILIATGLYPPNIGGPATYTKMLEDHLPQHGFTLTVAQYGWVRRYPKLLRHIAFAWKVYRQSVDCDAIYALDPVSVGVPVLIAATLRRKKFLLRVPGDYAWEQGQLRFGVTDRLHDFIQKRYSYGIRTSILCWVESFVAKRAFSVVVPSAYLVFVMEQWGVNTEKVTPIYSALFPLPVSESKESIRAQLGYNGTVLVSAGRMVPNKGFLPLIDMVAALAPAHPDLSLVIIGDGPERETIEARIQTLGIAERVRLPGSMSKKALGASIRGADLFVLNTAHEGMSHQLLEVMDLGVPIVTTDVGGNPELITDGVHGRLVPYGDHAALQEAVTACIQDTASCATYVSAAHEKTKSFAKETLVSALAAHLKHVV